MNKNDKLISAIQTARKTLDNYKIITINNNLGLKRVIRHDVKYANNLLESKDIYNLLFTNFDKLKKINKDLAGCASFVKTFNKYPISNTEALEICGNGDFMSISLKRDKYSAIDTVKEICVYLDELETFAINFRKFGIKLLDDNNLSNSDLSSLSLVFDLYSNFIADEINYITNILDNPEENNIVESATIQYYNDKCSSILLESEIINEEFNLQIVMNLFNNAILKIKDLASKSGITFKTSTINATKWKNELEGIMSEKVPLKDSDIKIDPNNKDKKTDARVLRLSYYDKNEELCRKSLIMLEKFYNTTPSFDRIKDFTDLDNANVDVENMVRNGGIITRESLVKELKLKEDANLSLMDMVKQKLQTNRDNLNSGGMMYGDLIEHYTKMADMLNRAQKLSDKAVNYNKKYTNKVKMLADKLKREEGIKNNNDVPKEANTDMTKNVDNDARNKPVENKEDAKKNDKRNPVEDKLNSINNDYVKSLNINIGLSQIIYTCIYTTMKEIEQYLNNLPKKSAKKGTEKTDTDSDGMNDKDNILK